jgi:flavorubredoxin
MDHIQSLVNVQIDYKDPVVLYASPGHSVWWVGSREDTPFRCNAYLMKDGDTTILFDPGSQYWHFDQVKERVSKICDPERITYIVVHHQDPDLCDSLPAWLQMNPNATLVCTPRTRVLLPYYGFDYDINWLDVSPNDSTVIELPSGKALAFITSPFLHFPEACVTFDEATGYLFSSDIGAAIEQEWRLVIDDWEAHWKAMVPFHVFYMANNRALRGFIQKIDPFPITNLLPQHGSIIPKPFVRKALARLRELPCGIDLLYPASNLEAALSSMGR